MNLTELIAHSPGRIQSLILSDFLHLRVTHEPGFVYLFQTINGNTGEVVAEIRTVIVVDVIHHINKCIEMLQKQAKKKAKSS